MNLLPKASGSRPRVACEIFAGGVVAGRSPEPGLPLAAVAKVGIPADAILPSLKPGNIANRVAVIAALRRALEQVGARSNLRNGELTLVIPDAAVRVLLLDFDALPTKLSEALPIVRFRLKKLIPFEPDDAMVSFQVMSTSRSMIRVLAVAIPRDVLGEYESAAREAGYEPGAVLPSTLAALAAVDEGDGASLLVNAHPEGVTTAIVRAGILLLHRAVELGEGVLPMPANLPAALFEGSAATPQAGPLLPLVDRDDSQAEWAAQEPLPEHGRNPYADRIDDEAVTQNQDAITGMPVPYAGDTDEVQARPYGARAPQNIDLYAGEAAAASEDREPVAHTLAPDAQAEEIARAVSVAIAYFEDSLSVAPETLLSAGPLGAEQLNRVLREQGVAQEEGVRVREMIDPAVLAPAAVTSAVPRSWLAGVTGALKS